MNYIEKLNAAFDGLSRTHKKLASYIKDNLNEAAFLTLDELSSRVGTSTTTVIRFSRVLGYDGFSDMLHGMQAYLQEMMQEMQEAQGTQEVQDNISVHFKNPENTPHSAYKNHSIQSSGSQISEGFQTDIQNISRTFALQNEADLISAVDLITEAEHVYVLGMRNSFTTAYYMSLHLREIRNNVHLIHSLGMEYSEEISGAGPGDVCIAYLFPRYSKVTATTLSWMKNEGVKTIVISSPGQAALKLYSDILLPCCVSPMPFNCSFAAAISLTDHLISAIAGRIPEKAKKKLQKNETLLSNGYYLGI